MPSGKAQSAASRTLVMTTNTQVRGRLAPFLGTGRGQAGTLEFYTTSEVFRGMFLPGRKSGSLVARWNALVWF